MAKHCRRFATGSSFAAVTRRTRLQLEPLETRRLLTTVTFDQYPNGDRLRAPCLFSQTTSLTDLFAPLGVVFLGPGEKNGGAIVNQCGNWGVYAHSNLNFLGINPSTTLKDGGKPIAPQTIRFDNLMTSVSLFVAGGDGAATVQMFAYNDFGEEIGRAGVKAKSWERLSVQSYLGIREVVLVEAGTDSTWIMDDLTFSATLVPPSAPEFGGFQAEPAGGDEVFPSKRTIGSRLPPTDDATAAPDNPTHDPAARSVNDAPRPMQPLDDLRFDALESINIFSWF
jgi:hypothetical protein